ncbi:MAG: SusC/RagA family TonB-linked outer membrane protein [Arachidicoccus sp.]|nr:SusC/RagA family TonB-linked outer membrane protein [Arachidicoccus sp.]
MQHFVIKYARKKSCVLIAILLLTGSVYAQNKKVSGIVSSAIQNVPMAGVSVLVKGTNKGTFTTPSGSYEISLTGSNDTLVFTYIGYQTQIIPITGSNINVSMYSDSTNNLSDVVVIGYGAVRKENVSGAITTLTTKDFQTGTVTSFDQMIQGKAAGVSVTPNGGRPGSGGTILIRGMSTINGNASPLVVVDGVPFGGYVNPNDVESVTILKDASAAAIYGSQASGGVILITTKKGKPGEIQMNFNTLVSDGQVPKYISVLNATQFRNVLENSPYFSDQPAVAAMMGNANTDWQKLIYQSAITSNSNLSLRGAIGKSLPYRLSVGYLNQDGILKTDNMKRETGSLSLTPSLFQNHLKIGLNLNGSLTQSRLANTGAIGSAVSMDPTEPVRSDSSLYAPWGGYYQWFKPDGTPNNLAPENPIALLNQTNDRSNYKRGYGNLKLDYSLHFLPELHLIANWGFDVNNYHETYRADSMSLAAYRANGNLAYGNDNPSSNKTRNLLAEYTLNYNKTFSSIKSNINAMATYSYQDYKYTSYNYRSYDYKGDTIPATTVPNYPYNLTQRTLISFLGRLIYTYDDKYVFTGSYRRDGSSVLAPANRWVGFYSLALAWNMKKENFLKNAEAVSTLKFRASYGQTANQGGIADYSFYPGYYISTQQSEYQFGNTFYQMYTPSAYNAQLTWEVTTSPDLGLDFGFLNDRISGSFDWYDKHTKNLIVSNVPIPAGTNFSNVVASKNVGNMINKGFELNLNLIPVQSKEIEWSVNLNAAYNKGTITKLLSDTAALNGQPAGGISGGTGATIQGEYVGESPNSFLVNRQVYDAQGKPIEGAYVDIDGDGSVAPGASDLYYYHSPYPSWVLGFSTNLKYKRWSFSTVLRANLGNYVYNNVASNMGVLNLMGSTGTAYLANASSDVLKTGFVKQQLWSDYYVQNASFLKMDNIGIAYNIGKISHSDKTNLTVNFNVQNVFTVTKYSGANPEVFGGIDNNFYMVPRTYTLGLNLNF